MHKIHINYLIRKNQNKLQVKNSDKMFRRNEEISKLIYFYQMHYPH